MMPRARKLLMPSANDRSPLVSLDARFTAAIRCILAVAVLLVIALDPMARVSFPGVAHFIVAFYITYSLLLYIVTCWWRPIWLATVEPWLDLGCVVGMTLLSSDLHGIL